MMKRRQQQASPSRKGAQILPEYTPQDNDSDKTKIHKSSRPLTNLKRAMVSVRIPLTSLHSLLILAGVCALAGTLFFLLNRYIFIPDQRRPLLLHLAKGSVYKDVNVLDLQNDPQHFITDRRNLYWIDNGASWHYPYEDDIEENDKCVNLGEWQTDHNIFSCNPFHEVSLVDSGFNKVGAGSYRDAWSFHTLDGDKYVLKTLAWKKHLDWDEYPTARREAMSYAQTSAAPHVANMYGACSHSTIMEYSPDGILWWLFDDFEPTKDELLKIAFDVSSGVAEAENVDAQGRPTICHMDVKANQFLLVDGTYKINDFNFAEFLKWDPEEDEYCSFEGGYSGRWQAPEQISRHTMLDDEKSDVFSLGYVVYFLLMGDQQWADDSSRNAAKWARSGIRPPIPNDLMESNNTFDRAAIDAIQQCLQYEPKDRPTAQQIADLFRNAMEEGGVKDEPLNMKRRVYTEED